MTRLSTRIVSGVLAAALSLQGPAMLALASPQTATQASGANPATPMPTLQWFHTLYAQIFGTLFGQPYDPAHWSYPLTSHVSATGTYSGMNQYGQTFEFQALVANVVDIDLLPGLTPAQLQMAHDDHLRYSGVQGILDGPMGSVPVDGVVITRTVAGSDETNLAITAQLPADAPVLHFHDGSAPATAPPPPSGPPPAIPDVDATPTIVPDYAFLLDAVDPPETQLAAINGVWERVLGVTPEKGEYGIRVAGHVAAPGSYSSPSGLASDVQPYTFHVDEAEALDITKLSQVPAKYAGAVKNGGFEYYRVRGLLESGLDAAYVDGLTVAAGNGDSALFVMEELADPEQPSGDIGALSIPLPIPVPYFCLDQSCADACKATRDAAIAAAQAACTAAHAQNAANYQAAVNSAQATQSVETLTVETLYVGAIALCTKAQAAGLLSCALIAGMTWFIGPATLLLCLARQALLYAACIGAAALIAQQALAAINNAYTAAVAAAAAAQTAADAAADAAKQAAIDAANAAYDACVAGCWHICWIIIWIWVPLPF